MLIAHPANPLLHYSIIPSFLYPIPPSFSHLPTLAVIAFHPLVQFRHILYPHVRAVPFHLLPFTGLLGQVAEHCEFSEARAVIEIDRRIRLACATRLDEIREDVLGA